MKSSPAPAIVFLFLIIDMGAATIEISLGLVVGPLLGTWFVSASNFEVACAVFGGLVFTLVPWVMVYLRRVPRSHHDKYDSIPSA